MCGMESVMGVGIWEKGPWQAGPWAGAGILGKEYTRRVDTDYLVNSVETLLRILLCELIGLALVRGEKLSACLWEQEFQRHLLVALKGLVNIQGWEE